MMSDLTTEELEDACTICHKPQEAHRQMHHSFSPHGRPTALFEKSPEAPAAPSGGAKPTVRLPSASDPILRMVLLRAGVITVAQLDAVEEELRATGVAGHVLPDTLG